MKTLTLPAYDGVMLEDSVQWWYWTVHLKTSDGRRFGSELCFFAFTVETLLGQKLRDDLRKRGIWERLVGHLLDRHGFQLAQCALTDVQNAGYHHTAMFAGGMPPVLPGKYKLDFTFPVGHRATAEGGGGRDHVLVQFPEWQLDLVMTNDDKVSPPAQHYDGGSHNYLCGGYTYYYSRPRMDANGLLTFGGETLPVTGTAWFDRQLGDLNAVVHKGWQWFAMQLNDGTNVMLFDILNLHGEELGAIMRGDAYQRLGPEDFTVEVLSQWTSPSTKITYPAAWRIIVSGQQYIVTPTVADQEFSEPTPFPTYWEGDCSVTLASGETVGQAYVELNGFHKSKP